MRGRRAGMSERGRGRRQVAAPWLVIVLLALAAGLSGLPAWAQIQSLPPVPAPDERARSLDALFKGLKIARGDDEAEVLVARIWEVWTGSGRADVDQLMKEGIGYLS